jgi:hypothetical protein
MVSIEENSLGDVLGTKLPKGVLAGLRGVTSPDAPAVAYAKPAEAPSYGAGEPEALAYLAQTDAAPAALNQPGSAETAPNAATLVVDNDAAQRALEQEQLEAARAAALADIDDQLAQARLDDNVPAIQRLEGEKLKVMSAKTLGAIASAQGQTTQISGSVKAESPEEKAERLWQQAIKAEEKAQAESHKFDAWKSKEALEKENAAEKRYKEALEEYERLKANHATQAELEAARKRVQSSQITLLEARQESVQTAIDNKEMPPEQRDAAKKLHDADASTLKKLHEETEGKKQDERTHSVVVQGTAAVEVKEENVTAKFAGVNTGLASNRTAHLSTLEARMATIDSSEQSAPKPTALAHAEVGVLEATGAAPNVQGGGKAGNAGAIKI